MSDSGRPRSVFAGLGSWGQRLLPRVTDLFDVVALVSAGSPRSRVWSSTHHGDTSYFASLDEALALPCLDAVFLATPTATHAHLAERALEAGCHVFVEKPSTLNPQDALRIEEAARQRGLEVFTGYVYLFHPAMERLRSLAPARHVRSVHLGWTRPQLSGPIHEELLCHDICMVIALTGELPDQVRVLDGGDEHLRCTLDLPSGRTCTTSASVRVGAFKSRTVHVYLNDGTSYRWQDDELFLEGQPRRNLAAARPSDPLHHEVVAFHAAVTGNGPRMVDDSRWSVGIATLLQDVAQSLEAPS